VRRATQQFQQLPAAGLLLALRLEVCDLDCAVEGIDDLTRRSRDSGCADDRCAGGEDTAHLFGVDSDLGCRFEVEQIRHPRGHRPPQALPFVGRCSQEGMPRCTRSRPRSGSGGLVGRSALRHDE
jgi:hypothetical protein